MLRIEALSKVTPSMSQSAIAQQRVLSQEDDQSSQQLKMFKSGIKDIALADTKKGDRPEVLFTGVDIKKLHDWTEGYLSGPSNNSHNTKPLPCRDTF